MVLLCASLLVIPHPALGLFKNSKRLEKRGALEVEEAEEASREKRVVADAPATLESRGRRIREWKSIHFYYYSSNLDPLS